MRVTFPRLLAVAIVVIFCSAASASKPPVAHNVMLSWKGPSGWCFLFFKPLPLPFTGEDLAHFDDTAIGIPALKQRLARHFPWRDIAWRDQNGCHFRATHPFRYPPAHIRDDIVAFAKQHGVSVEIVPTIYD
jgi:hypothetical protein